MGQFSASSGAQDINKTIQDTPFTEGLTCLLAEQTLIFASSGHLVVRSMALGPVFIRKDGTFLTQQAFVLAVRKA